MITFKDYVIKAGDCTCLVQNAHLSCPLTNFTCNNCPYNPINWSGLFSPTFLANALNQIRENPFYKCS